MVGYKNIFGFIVAVMLLLPNPVGAVGGEGPGVQAENQGLGSVQKNDKKSHFARNVGLGAISLGALAASSYGLYWANDYNLKKTLKPAIQLSFVSTLMTAGYLCAGKFVLGAMVKAARKEIGSLGELLQDMIKNAAQTTNDMFVTKLEDIKKLLALYMKKFNPWNWGKSDVSLMQEIMRERQEAEEKKKREAEEKKQEEEDNKDDGEVKLYRDGSSLKDLMKSGYFRTSNTVVLNSNQGPSASIVSARTELMKSFLRFKNGQKFSPQLPTGSEKTGTSISVKTTVIELDLDNQSFLGLE